jgi:multiple antibiotic resistance protein
VVHEAIPTSEDIKFAVMALAAVFFVVDPFAIVPIFLAITRGDDVAKRKAAARLAAIAALLTLVIFAFAGSVIFRAFGISLGAFKVAGGLMLFLMSVDMMRAQPSRTRSSHEEQADSEAKEDVALVPLAIPLLAGPGSIATVMVLISRAHGEPYKVASIYLSAVFTCVVAWLLMRWSALAERFLRHTYLHAIERVMGLLLAAIAVEFVVGGLKDLLPALR